NDVTYCIIGLYLCIVFVFFFFQAEDGIRDRNVTGVQTCALPIYFNRDGVLDILSVDDRRVTTIMLVSPGPQDPSYQAAVNLPAGPNPNSIALGEFNRNGKLDIAVADFNNTVNGVGSLGIIHNNGTGSFQPFVSFPVATG